MRLAVEEIEHIEMCAPCLVELVTDAQIGDRARVRAHAVVFREWIRRHVTQLKGSGPGTEVLDRRTELRHERHRPRDIRAVWIADETCIGVAELCIEQ